MGELEDMNAFVRIVEAGGFGRAADQLGVAKSALSRRLADLEERLGVQLLNRTTRRSSLTEAGRSYYQRALQILGDVEELNAEVSDTRARLRGTLKVAVPLSFGLMHLSPVLQEFAEANPELVIHLDFADRQVSVVEEGFDLVIRIAELRDSTLVARKLAPINLVVCASPDYLARAGEPRSPEDLKAHSILKYDNAPRSAWTFIGPGDEEVSVNLETRMSANNGDFLRDAAIAGFGIVISPTFVAYRDIESGRLARILTDYRLPALNAYAIYPRTRHLSRRARILIDFLIERFSGQPYWDRIF
jgi:DNA-binding transcriptional LysR family regulator